jgi:hypothetical protein
MLYFICQSILGFLFALVFINVGTGMILDCYEGRFVAIFKRALQEIYEENQRRRNGTYNR